MKEREREREKKRERKRERRIMYVKNGIEEMQIIQFFRSYVKRAVRQKCLLLCKNENEKGPLRERERERENVK